MDFLAFITILLDNGVNLHSNRAIRLFNQLSPFFVPVVEQTTDYDLMLLRAKLGTVSVHEQLVQVALKNFPIMSLVRESRKIMAIKELRLLTNCGLKEAKDAIEDSRVWGQFYHPSY